MPAASNNHRPRVLIGGVGYQFLRDLSVGPHVVDLLKEEPWPDGVEFEDLSYGPIGVMHNLEERPGYDRMILISGAQRDRTPGEVYTYRWEGRLPAEAEIQERVAEAVTGVISLDNLLIIGTYFERLPQDVRVIEVEALEEEWGESMSPPVRKAVPRVMKLVRKMVEEACG